MDSLIVLFGKNEEGRAIRNLLLRNGYEVAALCNTGAQALAEADMLDGGIVVCGYRYPDMICKELADDLPKGFELLLIARADLIEEGVPEEAVLLKMPLATVDLFSTLGMMLGRRERIRKKKKALPKKRSAEEQALIDRAKALLMERNHMSEEEAHRYLQKCSMDSGTGLTESAGMILSMMEETV
ncbi:MAG: ANTAR domain-containing protein [Lachnospiraceae bacterium]|nr:ANTAR domain-containing protein [Lachnospiraceae bacterium]